MSNLIKHELLNLQYVYNTTANSLINMQFIYPRCDQERKRYIIVYDTSPLLYFVRRFILYINILSTFERNQGLNDVNQFQTSIVKKLYVYNLPV